MIFSMEEVSISGDGTRFSTARTTPSGVVIPTVVDPSCELVLLGSGHTLMASMAYSTWNRRPCLLAVLIVKTAELTSGEKVLTPRSYSDLIISISADMNPPGKMKVEAREQTYLVKNMMKLTDSFSDRDRYSYTSILFSCLMTR